MKNNSEITRKVIFKSWILTEFPKFPKRQVFFKFFFLKETSKLTLKGMTIQAIYLINCLLWCSQGRGSLSHHPQRMQGFGSRV